MGADAEHIPQAAKLSRQSLPRLAIGAYLRRLVKILCGRCSCVADSIRQTPTQLSGNHKSRHLSVRGYNGFKSNGLCGEPLGEQVGGLA